jgi:hypothetical protein
MKGRSMKNMIFFLLFISLSVSSGCAYKAYFGFHGSSIKQHADIHELATTDRQCLQCHHPEAGEAEAPETPHPNFKGCLKCHNDNV